MDSDSEEDRLSLVLFLLGSLGYEYEADRVARVSHRILQSEQIVEGISRFQFPCSKKTRLMYAARVGNLQRLKFIAGLGARVNMTALGDYWEGQYYTRPSQYTALHFASRYGHVGIIQYLLDNGAELEARTALQWTALHVAAWSGHLAVAELLLARGAQIDLQETYGRTPLNCAAYRGKIDVARYLCEKGANTLLKGYGDTPYENAGKTHGFDSPIALFLSSYPYC